MFTKHTRTSTKASISLNSLLLMNVHENINFTQAKVNLRGAGALIKHNLNYITILADSLVELGLVDC